MHRQPTATYWYLQKKWMLAGAFIATATLLFALFPTRFFFLNDDFIHIPMASDGTIGHHNGARHMNDLSLYLDYLWSGNNAVGYHVTNALLHLFNIVLLRNLLLQLCASLSVEIPRMVTGAIVGLFAVYAVHAEALFWILCRTASLSLCFVFLSWLSIIQTQKKWWYLLPSIAFFVLALFTYETSWLLPVYLFIWWWLGRKGHSKTKPVFWPMATLWVVFLAYLPLRKWMINEVISSYEAGDILQPNAWMIATKSIRLFFRTFLPPISQTGTMLIGWAVIVMVLGIIIWKVFQLKLTNKLWWFLTLCWLVSYLPFVSLGVSVTGYESDRYLYFVSLFASAWLVYSLYLLTPWFPKITGIIVTLLFLFHAFFLIKASNDFSAAGKVSSATLQLLKSNAHQPSIAIRKLPATWKGIPIFRYGFTDALNWRLGKSTAQKITVMSTTVFTGKSPVPILFDTSANNVTVVFDQPHPQK